MSAVRVVLADDNELLRTGTVRALSRHFDVVAEAADGPGTVAAIATHAPDVLVVDMFMPKTDPVELVTTVRALHPYLRIIVFSGYAEAPEVAALRSRGVSAIMAKPTPPQRLIEAIDATARARLPASDGDPARR